MGHWFPVFYIISYKTSPPKALPAPTSLHQKQQSSLRIIFYFFTLHHSGAFQALQDQFLYFSHFHLVEFLALREFSTISPKVHHFAPSFHFCYCSPQNYSALTASFSQSFVSLVNYFSDLEKFLRIFTPVWKLPSAAISLTLVSYPLHKLAILMLTPILFG